MAKPQVYLFRLQIPEDELRMLARLANMRNVSLSDLLHSLIRAEYAREVGHVEGRLERYAQRLEGDGEDEGARHLRAVVQKLKGPPPKRRRRYGSSQSRTR